MGFRCFVIVLNGEMEIKTLIEKKARDLVMILKFSRHQLHYCSTKSKIYYSETESTSDPTVDNVMSNFINLTSSGSRKVNQKKIYKKNKTMMGKINHTFKKSIVKLQVQEK